MSYNNLKKAFDKDLVALLLWYCNYNQGKSDKNMTAKPFLPTLCMTTT